MALENPVIAIDGYSSCGKSTVARSLAQMLGIRYIDSGAMYRAVTLFFLENQIPIPLPHKPVIYDYSKVLDKIEMHFNLVDGTNLSKLVLNGTELEDEIRTMEVSENVSHVSAIKEVRYRMVQLQKQMKLGGGLVMDGRDIGTTVFPDADLKIFMTAEADVRAKRRFKELTDKGFQVTLDEVKSNISSRDYEDTHREESPLRQAKDAVLLDNTKMNFDEQVQFVINCLKRLVEESHEK